MNGDHRSGGGSRLLLRLGIAGVIALISIVGYYSRSSVNPVTGKTQHIGLSHEQEVALGLQSAPEMARQFGGLHPDSAARSLVDRVGQKVAAAIPAEAPSYPFQFHLLADDETVNAFALPGGQIFITSALLSRLKTEGQLAGVLGHEIGHVVGRHSAEQMAKAELTQGLVGAATVAASDSADGARSAQMIAGMVGQFVNLKYGRTDELESDSLGLRLMAAAGYDPRSLIDVMKILAEASGGRGGQPEFLSTHPDPGNRAAKIEELIKQTYPNGVPEGLTK